MSRTGDRMLALAAVVAFGSVMFAMWHMLPRYGQAGGIIFATVCGVLLWKVAPVRSDPTGQPIAKRVLICMVAVTAAQAALQGLKALGMDI